MRAANHHGRGSARHSRREFDVSKAPHIDPERVGDNVYWSWDGQDSFLASERAYYQEAFAASLEAQNQRHIERRQKNRIRTIDQVYEARNTQPEGSLLYIGCKQDGPVDPAVLWACVEEYRAWEIEESEALGGFYKPLTMALHADERGQIHVEERGVYQYRDASGNLAIGQAAALESAGFPLPDPSRPRDRTNNRKVVWDAARREKWLDIVEAHGFTVERTPEKDRGHMGLEAYQAWRDSMAEVEAQREAQAAAQAALDAREAELDAREEDQRQEQRRLDQQRETQQQNLDRLRGEYKAAQEAKRDADASLVALQGTKQSLDTWRDSLQEWSNGERERLEQIAQRINADIPESDAVVVAYAKSVMRKDGRTLWEAIQADCAARTPKEARTVTITKAPETPQEIIAKARAASEDVQQPGRYTQPGLSK